MTIGIAAYGPDAGQAVRRGMLAAEILGRGAIGGFAVFSVLDGRGRHRQVCCQDGGVASLALDAGFLAARCAAVISSGPNRPEPLGQFLSGAAGIGLVSGHRLPNRVSAAGDPVNRDALARMAAGLPAAEAVAAVARENPEQDFGLVAVSASGGIGLANTERVAGRADLGADLRRGDGFGHALLFNSIHAIPGLPLAGMIGDIIGAALAGTAPAHRIGQLAGPAAIETGNEDRIELGPGDRVLFVVSADPAVTEDGARNTVIYSRCPVWRGGRRLGHAISEVSAPVRGGRILPDPAMQNRFVIAPD
ncbi:DUF6963 family protein [Pukyongiella litopenaei]|uniref:Uncharacterized protein n=1 Tax=Pukyongiella litopenaei TaxID=2605946 RepID=A0A2S0MQF0_9RHOB|nr:hypothetical protein [Pukyongiella litopenaei]AVO37971.1 hypothetical protein C6Y53_09825 [Pukyongiella litopenaei]